MIWLILTLSAIAAWLVVRVLNATDGPDMRHNPSKGWWSRENTMKADARLGRNVIAAVITFLLVGTLLANLVGYDGY